MHSRTYSSYSEFMDSDYRYKLENQGIREILKILFIFGTISVIGVIIWFLEGATREATEALFYLIGILIIMGALRYLEWHTNNANTAFRLDQTKYVELDFNNDHVNK